MALGSLSPGLAAAYYRGRKFSADQLLLSRVDPAVVFDWGSESFAPGMLDDHFCARWVGFVKVTSAGHYTFATVTDDGVRLWVADKLLIDQWDDQPARKVVGEIDLPAGYCRIKLEYYEGSGAACCRLRWALRDGFGETSIPAEALYHEINQRLPAKPK